LVSVAEVKAKTIPQYLNGLGTVTAFNSVVVKSRVNGELVEVDIQEGQLVEAGQRLARVDARLFEAIRDQARAQLQRDAAALELARLNHDRIESLFTANSVSQQERDEVQAAFKQAQALVEVDRAALANAELQVSYCDILAPISGRVGLRLLDQGNMIQANDPRGLAVITQLQPISVLFPIPQDEIPRVQSRLKESEVMQVLAYDRSFQTKLAEGTLTALDNQVDPTTGTLRLKAVFANQDEALFPNQFVNVRLLIRPWEDALVVPSTAIQRVADELCVYVVEDDSKVQLQRVEVAFSEEGETVVTNGLKIGQKVVTEGTDKLKPGAEIKESEGSKR
jgi:multidrug efflux system membrane fusion protein